MRPFLTLLLMLAGLTACKSKKNVQVSTTEPGKPAVPVSADPGCPDIIRDAAYFSNVQNDAFQLDSAWMEGTRFHALVIYDGGCGGADFFLRTDWEAPAPAPANPSLILNLVDHDFCKKRVKKVLCFELSSLLTKGTEQTFYLRLKGWSGPLTLKSTN